MMERYQSYKDSGIAWIGEIPEHWEFKRLKYLVNANPSNIDKKSKDDERQVFLCNYVDVYKNEYISSELNFMKATATDEQIKKFTLKKGDVIATKDSETPDDIGVPALVTEDIENVVCGYHLTHIQPKIVHGSYLFRFFQTEYLKSYFKVSANGVTRFGLGVDKFNSALILSPPIEEQKAISHYLDRKTAEIDRLIAQKQRLIELYEQEKTALINHTVTKGINLNVKLKPSGIDWLGNIPEHWEIKKLKSILDNVIDNRGKTPPFGSVGIPMLEAKQIQENKTNPIEEFEKFVSENNVKKFVRKTLKKGDVILVTVGATAGKTAIIENEPCYFIAQNLVAFRPNLSCHSKFLYLVLKSNYFQKSLMLINKSNTIDNLKVSIFINNLCLLPPIEEQKIIAEYIGTETSRIDAKIAKTKKIIELQKEYRIALISEAVTGKIKVPELNVIEVN